MEMTLSRKFLNVAGLLDYIVGVLTLFLAAIVTASGIYIMMNPDLALAMPRDFGDYTILVVGIVLAAGAVFSLFYGHLERAAARNPEKIMPVWGLSILSVILEVGGIALSLVKGTQVSDLTFSFVGLLISILVLLAANNIKKEAGR